MASGSGGVSVRAGPAPRLDGRAGLRRAQRRHLQRQGRDPRETDGVDITCAQVCGACGQLAWPDRSGHPLRQDASSAPTAAACTHCGEQSWIDLGRDSTALALRSTEEDLARISMSGWRRIASRALFGAVVGGVAALLVADPPWTTSAIAILSGVIAGLHAYRQHRHATGKAMALPDRWFMALPPAGASEPDVRGPAQATGERLTAPLSGRPCVAYEIGARYDDRSDAAASTWALLEQQIAEAEVDGHAIDAAATHLALPRQRLGATSDLQLDERAQTYLRQRGLSAKATSMVLYESIVAPGAPVQLEISKGGTTLRLAPDSPAVVDG